MASRFIRQSQQDSIVPVQAGGRSHGWRAIGALDLRAAASGRSQCLRQRLRIPAALEAHASDEECWRPLDATTHAAHEVLSHPGLVGMASEVLFESRRVKPEI